MQMSRLGNPVLSLGAYVGAERYQIHLGAYETLNRLFRRTHDGLIFVEAGVEHHRDAGFAAKRVDQVVIKGILLAFDGLQPARIVYVIDRAQFGPLGRPDLVHMQHERRRMIVLEILTLVFLQNARGKGPKPLAPLDPRIEHVLHVRQSRMGKNGSVTQSARAPFHASLKPANYVSLFDAFADYFQ